MTSKARVRELVLARGWSVVGEREWVQLRAEFSEAAIRGSGVPIEPPWCGVTWHTLPELEESLRDFSRVYAERPDLRRYCREQVIAAKDRARWASRTEMVEWMLVWLGDPATFPVWARLRKDVIVG